MRLRSLLLLATPACVNEGKVEGTEPTEDDLAAIDSDGDGYATDEDCDDEDASVNPGATEVCDGVDNNCDDVVDEGVLDT